MRPRGGRRSSLRPRRAHGIMRDDNTGLGEADGGQRTVGKASMSMRSAFWGGMTVVWLMAWWGTAHVRAAEPAGAGPADGSFTGRVVETTNASRYTYVLVDTGKAKLWAAAPVFEVKVGDPVAVSGGMLMQNFRSDVLKRTFEELYLVPSITIAGAAASPVTPGLPAGHPPVGAGGQQAEGLPDFSGVVKPEGGKTVAEVWAGRAALSGQEVKVRAKVVRVLPEIMGLYWLHLRDGTGADGQNDLTVTAKTADVKAGDVVTVTGIVRTDKDFGAGYRYAVLIEAAAIGK